MQETSSKQHTDSYLAVQSQCYRGRGKLITSERCGVLTGRQITAVVGPTDRLNLHKLRLRRNYRTSRKVDNYVGEQQNKRVAND